MSKGEERMKKRNKKEDSGEYVLFVTTLMILYQSIKSYTFPFWGTRFSFSLFLLPFSYYIINFITKRFDYKKGVSAIAISSVIFVSFTSILSFIMNSDLILLSLAGDFCGYVVSQFINLLIYLYILKNHKNIGWQLGCYILSCIIFVFFQLLQYTDGMTFSYLFRMVSTTILFQTIVSFLLIILDQKER